MNQCVITVDSHSIDDIVDISRWIILAQAAVAIDAMCVRRDLSGSAIGLGKMTAPGKEMWLLPRLLVADIGL